MAGMLTAGARAVKPAAAVGLICGVLYSVGGLFVDLFSTGFNTGTALAFLALLGMPLIFAALGFAIGLTFHCIRSALRPKR